MPVGIEMIRSVKKSALLYKEEMLKLKALIIANEQENKQRENVETEKKKLLVDERELMSKHNQLQKDQKAAQLLTDKGTQLLENSLKADSLADAQAAHALIRSGNDKNDGTTIESSAKTCTRRK